MTEPPDDDEKKKRKLRLVTDGGGDGGDSGKNRITKIGYSGVEPEDDDEEEFSPEVLESIFEDVHLSGQAFIDRIIDGIESDSSLLVFLSDISMISMPTQEEEDEIKSILDDEAGEELKFQMSTWFYKNSKLVVRVAKEFIGKGLSLFELIAAGKVGLQGAIRNFTPERPYRFDTYAIHWIKSGIKRELNQQDEPPSSSVTHELLREDILDIMANLSPRERDVLRLRFGLDDGRTRTLEEVGRMFGVTRERIRQIEAKALRKLRHPNRHRRKPATETSQAYPEVSWQDMRSKLSVFKSKDRRILKLLWGYTDGECYSSREAANAFDVSVEYVEELERKARKMLD